MSNMKGPELEIQKTKAKITAQIDELLAERRRLETRVDEIGWIVHKLTAEVCGIGCCWSGDDRSRLCPYYELDVTRPTGCKHQPKVTSAEGPWSPEKLPSVYLCEKITEAVRRIGRGTKP